jgi:PmbA protein
MRDMQAREGELTETVSQILAEARKQGADGAEVGVSESVGLEVAVRKGELETVEFNQDRGFGITVYVGSRKGYASTSDNGTEAIENTVKAAVNIATYTQDDDCNGLADPELMATSVVDLGLYHPWDVEVDAAEAIAATCEAAALDVDGRIENSDGAEVSTSRGCTVYGNSHGFVGAYSGTVHAIQAIVIARDDKGMQRDYWYTMSRQSDLLEAAEAVGQRAGERTVARLGASKIETGEMPVLFAPEVASGLIGHLVGAISGGAIYRKASYLVDHVGEKVASDHISLVENPFIPGGYASRCFDGDGVATSAKPFVKAGVLESYVLSTYSARKLGMTSTGNAGGVHNLLVEGRTRTVEELLSEMGDGLLVTSLMGQGVNIVNGDYSRGASGFRVKNGQIDHAVDEVTVAANMKDLFNNIVGIGDDVDVRGSIQAPSILVASMTVGGS